jgi:SRSO17 transposase
LALVLDKRSWAILRRLVSWVDEFKPCFGRQAQQVSLGKYVEGLLNDSSRKSMQAMLERVREPVSYQAFQHFITHAPWDWGIVWKRLLAALPPRSGVLILDDTGFPKQGRKSVGVARQYSGTLGKVGNCQVAVTGALWAKQRAWLVGAELYLPEPWLTPERRVEARIPSRVQFTEKWRLALRLLRRARTAGLQVEAVVFDSEYGDVTAFRTALEKQGLLYGAGISSTLTFFRGRPRTRPAPRPPRGRPPTRLVLDGRVRSVSATTLAKQLPAKAWKLVSWRNGNNRSWQAEFAAVRVTPAHELRRGRRAKEVWLLCQRPAGEKTPSKYYLCNLPAEATLSQLVRLTHHRWAIEQQYQELKDELGLDHFEGRTFPGWHHHVVLCAIAYAFLQKERMRSRAPSPLTLPAIRAILQEIFTGLLFAANPRYREWLLEAQRHLPLRM